MPSPPLPDDPLPARLLAGRDEPSVLEKEAVFERVLAELGAGGSEARSTAAPRFGRRAPWLWAGAAGLAAAAALVLIILRPPAFGPSAELRKKGAAGEEAALELQCLNRGGQVGMCVPGGTLTFQVKPPSGYPYFAAFARRGDGTIIWYFPSAEGRALPVEPGVADTGAVPLGDGAAALRTGIVLDSTHPLGSIEVFGVFLARPLGRAEIKAALGDDLEPGEPERTRANAELRLVRRRFSMGGDQ